MSSWEAVEVALAHLYTVFIKRPHEHDAIKAYGSPRIFTNRLALVRRAADQYFVSAPDQAIEGDVAELLERVQRYSDRRNEVAHGIVRQMSWVRGLRDRFVPDAVGRFQYCLVPPHYTLRKFNQHNLLTYAYTSTELLTLNECLFWLAQEVSDLRRRVVPEDE
jgi:hypothetical protein